MLGSLPICFLRNIFLWADWTLYITFIQLIISSQKTWCWKKWHLRVLKWSENKNLKQIKLIKLITQKNYIKLIRKDMLFLLNSETFYSVNVTLYIERMSLRHKKKCVINYCCFFFFFFTKVCNQQHKMLNRVTFSERKVSLVVHWDS